MYNTYTQLLVIIINLNSKTSSHSYQTWLCSFTLASDCKLAWLKRGQVRRGPGRKECLYFVPNFLFTLFVVRIHLEGDKHLSGPPGGAFGSHQNPDGACMPNPRHAWLQSHMWDWSQKPQILGYHTGTLCTPFPFLAQARMTVE